MSKRRKSSSPKQRKGSQTKPTERKSQSLGQTLTSRPIMLGLLAAAGAVIVIAIVVLIFKGSDLTLDELTQRARGNLMLGRLNDAVVDYHRALNEQPENELIQYEQYLATARSALRSSSADQVVAAAERVKNSGEYPLLGSVILAQIYQQTGRTSAAAQEANGALPQAEALKDTSAQIALYEVLAMHFREEIKFDSAFTNSNHAIDLSQAVDDTFHLAISRLSAGIAALRIDSLEYAYKTFHLLRGYDGTSKEELVPVSTIALADYFERSGEYDSSLFYLDQVQERLKPGAGDATAAYGFSVLGRTKCAMEDHSGGYEFLGRSIDIYSDLDNAYEAIDAMNNLAECYRQARDWYNARKYYMAAGNLAETFEFKHENRYTADLNLRFLKELSPDEYKKAGQEGLELADSFSPGK